MKAAVRSQLTLQEIEQMLRARLPELRERYGVTSLGVFGSFVRGEQRPHSDLDILVELDERPRTLLQFIALENELGDQLGVQVDLVDKSTLKPAIGHHILEEVVTI